MLSMGFGVFFVPRTVSYSHQSYFLLWLYPLLFSLVESEVDYSAVGAPPLRSGTQMIAQMQRQSSTIVRVSLPV
jgi:hypothetical protein